MIDDTAKAILSVKDKVDVRYYPITNGLIDLDSYDFTCLDMADLQAMARLWLMRDEIRTALQKSADRLGNHQNAKTLLAKLDELKEG